MSGDTILLDAATLDVYFDLINPAGSGTLKIQSLLPGIDTAWKALNTYELYRPEIKAGKYYPLLVRASDNAWEFPAIRLVLYIVPTFWQTNAGIVLLGVLLSLVSICAIFLIIYYTRKIVSQRHLKQNYLLSLELKAIYAQINPHFIFNTLNTGLYFISESRNNEAYRHISSFSQLLRSYIKSARNKYIPLAEEIENLRNYITLQQQRFENEFEFQITVAEEIKESERNIPAFLLQPFVENAINHGLLHKNEKGHLLINFSFNNAKNEITCIIEDDGIGRERSAQINEGNHNKPFSYGSDLIADLVKVINADQVIRVNIEYIDKPEPNIGTKVVITLRNIHHEERLSLHRN
jgi:two-component sensor histidine kinase